MENNSVSYVFRQNEVTNRVIHHDYRVMLIQVKLISQQNLFDLIMKQTSSHSSAFRYPRKQKDHLEILDRSQEPSKLEDIQKINEEEEQFIPNDIQRELQLNIEKYSAEVKQEIRYLLMDLLKYPLTYLSQRHRCAQKLGYYDLKHIKNKQKSQSTFLSSRFHPDFCQDCGLQIQQIPIPMCSSIWQFPKVGIASYLLFKNMKTIMAMLFTLGCIFSIISLYVDITYISTYYAVDLTTFPLMLSNGILLLLITSNSAIIFFLQALAFLQIFVVLVWWFLNFLFQCFTQKYQRIVDQNCLSAADFTVMLQNVPIHYSNQRIQTQFNRYFQSLVFSHNIKNTWGEVLKPFSIKKICRTVPFILNESDVLDRELQGLDHDIYLKKKLFADWIIEMKVNSRFTYKKAERMREYMIFEKMLQRRKQKVLQMEQRARQQYSKANKNVTTTIFVTFDYNQSAQIVQNLNPQTLPAKIRYYLSFQKSTQYFDFRDYKKNETADVVVSRAPEPEDIVWGFVAVPLNIKIIGKLIVWGAMIVLSGILLAIVYGISFAQISGAGMWSAILIGFFITFFNMLTKFTLRKLSQFQKDFTQTERQRGILLKGLFVMAFNWTIPLTVTNIANENSNIYGASGYIVQLFWVGIFQAFLPPLVRIFDPQHLFKLLIIFWKSRPYNKLSLKQSELNEYYEHEEYQLGWVYTYFFNYLFFTLFYINLHPGFVILGLLGCPLMMLAEKYCLLHRSHRPERIAKALSETVQTLFSLSPFILWFGHLIWVNVLLKDFSSLIFTGNMVLMAVSVLYFITPWKSIYTRLCHIPEQELLCFDECRLKLPSQYDRLNPATLDEGFADYVQYVQERKKQDEKTLVNNQSAEHLFNGFDTQYVIDEISKIPSIFGRRNEVTKKMERNEVLRPRNVKGEDIEFMISNNKDTKNPYLSQSHVKIHGESKQQSPESKINEKPRNLSQSTVEVRVQNKLRSPPEKNNRLETEQNLGRYKQQDILSYADTQKKPVVNESSSGNTFGRKKVLGAEKRKTISVVQSHEHYKYDNRSKQI